MRLTNGLATTDSPQCVIPRHQNATRRILYRKRRYPSIPVLICKRDVKGAFKQIPVSIRGLAYMGCRFSVYISMYIALFFGWRPSPENCGLASPLLMQYIAAYRPLGEFTDGPEPFIDYQYVDDGAFVEPWIGLRPWPAVSLWERALLECLGTNSAHQKKREIEGDAATKLPLWGIVVCAESETFSMPSDKVGRAREFLATANYDPCVTRLDLRSLQELRGKLEQWSV